MFDLRERVCVVTGAGSGIGRALALELARRGASLALCDVNMPNCSTVQQECAALGARATAHRCDVSRRAELRDLARSVREAHGGKVHVLINNAGIVAAGNVMQVPEESYDSSLGVLLHGVIDGTREFLPTIREQDRGCIVNIASLCSYWVLPGTSAYTTCKFAVRGFSESLLVDARHEFPHVNVLCVHPEFIRTGLIDSCKMYNVTEPDAQQKSRAEYNLLGDKFGPTAESAARQIVNAIQRGDTRLRVGGGSALLDYAVRIWPRAFANPLVNRTIFILAICMRLPLLILGTGAAAVVARRRTKSLAASIVVLLCGLLLFLRKWHK
eukprot:TRINITY_DN70130_c0_g1_i1.p1 TRINITY_DN70130_c0_g1~~TRINITY_DN70130_c0_g1_i1.p1  ORF type:complete len:326 (+),score=89.86 TRINITY_DN70130_c0_g1_i1:80-1057(+)